jgi:hypothetical protein
MKCGLFTGLALAACGASSTSLSTESNGADLPSAAQASNVGACVSGENGPCGGFVMHPCSCASGLTCTPSGIPDEGGTCQPAR